MSPRARGECRPTLLRRGRRGQPVREEGRLLSPIKRKRWRFELQRHSFRRGCGPSADCAPGASTIFAPKCSAALSPSRGAPDARGVLCMQAQTSAKEAMASRRSSSESASQGRQRLEEMALAVLHGLCTGEECCIAFPDRTAVEFSEEKGCYTPREGAAPRQRRLRSSTSSMRMFSRFLAVSRSAHALVSEQRTMSMREFYYVRPRGSELAAAPRGRVRSRSIAGPGCRPTRPCSTLSRSATTRSWTWPLWPACHAPRSASSGAGRGAHRALRRRGR